MGERVLAGLSTCPGSSVRSATKENAGTSPAFLAACNGNSYLVRDLRFSADGSNSLSSNDAWKSEILSSLAIAVTK